MMHVPALLWGSVVHRPYVYAFFVCFLVFAVAHLGWLGTFAYTAMAFAIAFACEYSATRNGFPFGYYVYFDQTRTRELWLSNVPFWDSLSFVFLSYFSWRYAGALVDLLSPAAACLGGFYMMLLDVVIDPVTLRGGRWFLGRIYDYPQGGLYYGVTLTNFAGWFFVGALTIFAAQLLIRRGFMGGRARANRAKWTRGCLGVYAGVLLFGLAITVMIGEWKLFFSSCAVTLTALAPGAALFSKGKMADEFTA